MEKPRKLRLDVNELCVENFETGAHLGARGTVHGQEPPDTASGDIRGCVCDTYMNTCMGGCGPSQQYTCPKPYECQDNDTNYGTCMASCGWQGGEAVWLPNC